MIFGKPLVIGLGCAALLAGGTLYYFQTLISKVTEHPSARIQSEPFVPQATGIEVRSIDLGFSRFSLPMPVPGSPVQMHGTLFVSLRSEAQIPILTICAPFSERDAAVQDLLAQLRVLLAEPAVSWFEAQKRTLEIQPFTVFGALTKGLRASARDLTLLVMKGLCFGAARGTVRIFENESVGAFVYHAMDGTFVQVHDKTTGVSQLFMVSPDAGNLDEIASAIIRTYRANAAGKSEAELLELLRSTGIPNVDPPSPGTVEDEELRLLKVAEEVRKRRIERSK
jgi:hypothetical protein